jgi:hypothetical protein
MNFCAFGANGFDCTFSQEGIMSVAMHVGHEVAAAIFG